MASKDFRLDRNHPLCRMGESIAKGPKQNEHSNWISERVLNTQRNLEFCHELPENVIDVGDLPHGVDLAIDLWLESIETGFKDERVVQRHLPKQTGHKGRPKGCTDHLLLGICVAAISGNPSFYEWLEGEREPEELLETTAAKIQRSIIDRADALGKTIPLEYAKIPPSGTKGAFRTQITRTIRQAVETINAERDALQKSVLPVV